LLIDYEKVMNEEEDKLLGGIIALVFGLMNLIVNFPKGCIFGFLKKEVALKLIEFKPLYYTSFFSTPINRVAWRWILC
jgi:hypothetical protein